MEQNLPIIAKKFWHMVKVVLFMLKKGISKGKLMVDLSMLMKRGKIAGKAIQNLMFHHSHNWLNSIAAAHHRAQEKRHHLSTAAHPSFPDEYYEFSCSESPATFFPFKKKNHRRIPSVDFFSCNQTPAHGGGDDEVAAVHAVMNALQALNLNGGASPALPGFGKSPLPVRQLRITDSPFPLQGVDEDCHVDEAAEEFISRFYRDLRRQNAN